MIHVSTPIFQQIFWLKLQVHENFLQNKILDDWLTINNYYYNIINHDEAEADIGSRAAVENLNFRAWSTFLVPVCTASPGHWVNKADTQRLAGATRLTRSDFRLNLLLLKGQRCVKNTTLRVPLHRPCHTSSHCILHYSWHPSPPRQALLHNSNSVRQQLIKLRPNSLPDLN